MNTTPKATLDTGDRELDLTELEEVAGGYLRRLAGGESCGATGDTGMTGCSG